MTEDTKPSAPSEEAAREAARVWYANIAHEATVHGKLSELALALDAFAARAVAAERERCLRIIREEVDAAKRAAAIRRGEP